MNSPKPILLVTRILPCQAQARLQQLHSRYDVVQLDDRLWSKEELIAKVQGVHGIVCITDDCMDADVMDAAGPTLKVISTVSVGFNHIDVPEAKRRGIALGYTPDVLTDATAEIAVALTLGICRRVVEGAEVAKAGKWSGMRLSFLLGPQLSQKTIGIVGLGRIGQGIAQRLNGFNLARLVYSGRRPNPKGAAAVGAEYVSFETLLQASDIVIIACSLNDSTCHLFDTNAFRQMKSTAYLVNISRGSVVKQDDLVAALQNHEIAGAGLDVTTPEPLPADHLLYQLPNCLVLPHMGSASVEARETMGAIALDNVVAGMENQPLRCPLEG
ncbi:hypothetical protein H4R34_002306 [Dimargaris verticillata]|uniref:Glyoxylate reductase n=1 Tax=Dimargaris verticillata TaxID=2761393 RepID=A0A9W8EA38_9FUNG|nr:hypothetical protein H4R34_002306 [Dimargaris verticillata]